ncbi:MAG TPA: hypothetical protein VKE94_19775, partial [Gemmataceae bacterium]|nr:hypothetical protein [Gemmataceae bacterium]
MSESPASPAPHRWHVASGNIPGKKAPRGWGPTVAVVATMLVLAGAIAALIWWIHAPPKPRFVGVWIDQYTDGHVPPNPWSAQNRDALLGLGWRDKHHFGRQELTSVRADLAALHDERDPSIVVYLGARAMAGDGGDVAVLPSDADLERPESWLSLRDVLRSVSACPAKHKLLVLDIMESFVAPRSGVLVDDVATRTEALVKKATDDDPNLLVLSACAAGQTALDSQDLGHSVFAYYLLRGLSG